MPVIARFGGGGGGGLNFKVKAYTELPASGSENEIAVITTTPISGYVMQGEQPAGTDGLVWIETSGVSETPIWVDKKHTVRIYPVVARQYVDGAWISVPAECYQNGEWSSFFKFLYKNGDLCESVSGGWVLEATYNDGSFKDTYIDTTGANNYGNNIARTTLKVDVTGYRSLMANLTCANPSGKLSGRIGLNVDTSFDRNVATIVQQTFEAPSEETTQDITCDISSVDGEYYVYVFSNFNNSEGDKNYVRVNRVSLIP